MFADELTVVLAFGVAITWLARRLPRWLRTRHVRNLRRQVLDMHRIEAAFKGIRGPNPRELRVLRVPLRDRLAENWQVYRAWWNAGAPPPRTPEGVALMAYQRELAARTA